MAGGFEQRRFVGLEINAGEAGEAVGREIFAVEGEIDEADDLGGVGAAFAADTGDQGFGVIDDAALDPQLLLGDQHADGAHGGERVAGLLEPGGIALELNLGAEQQRHHRRLGIGGGAEDPAGGRLIEAVDELAVRGGGDGRHATEDFGELTGEAVGAAMAAEQRHD